MGIKEKSNLTLTLKIGPEKFFNSYGKKSFVSIESKTRNVITAINEWYIMVKRDPHSACVANAVKSSIDITSAVIDIKFFFILPSREKSI